MPSVPAKFLSAQAAARVYSFADLSGYSFKNRVLIRFLSLIFFAVIKIISSTVKFELEGWENWEAGSRDGVPIYTAWHSTVFLSTYFWRKRGIVVMSSHSFDAEYMARTINRFGYGTVRGSSTRRHLSATTQMIRLVRNGHPAGFTIDGPKGPRHVAKMGAVLVAKKSGRPVLPFTICAARRWELSKAWDQTQIPKPFTRARVLIAPPIFVPADADDSVLTAKRDELQRALDELEQRGAQWRADLSST